MSVKIITGDCRQVLKTMDEESVHCCVTSPPYWGLRDYGVDGQIGLERTPDEFVAEMVAVFREVRRVLRSDGTLWLNLGDCYATGAGKVGEHPGGGERGRRWAGRPGRGATSSAGYRGGCLGAEGKQGYAAGIGPMTQPNRLPQDGLKPKDLVGIPWMVAFALRADGWWLRQDIIWHKINPTPESVEDRCTKTHEYLFLLSKSESYHYDFESIMEPSSPESHARAARGRSNTHKYADGGPGDQTICRKSPSAGRIPGVNPKASIETADGVPRPRQNASFSAAISRDGLVPMRNKRSVWSTVSEPFSGAHFATFPPSLITPCIKAGCPEGGLVLDPFGGSGTTGMVADRLKRNAVLIELNPDTVEIADRRVSDDAGELFGKVVVRA